MALVKENMHIPLERVWRILKERLRSLPPEDCPVQDSLGRRLSCDLFSGRNVPHYNGSAMDGYAVSSRTTAGAVPSSPVVLGEGEYLWVNTGNPIPPQFDSVVMVEDTLFHRGRRTISVARSLVAGENIRPLGEDVTAGQVIARRGEKVTPALASLMAVSGCASVKVAPLPKSLYIPTGDEIVPLEEWLATDSPPAGKIGETNSLLVKGYFDMWGLPLHIGPCLSDDPERMESYLREQEDKYDLILVCAGSAKGERDHTFSLFERIGQPLFRWLLMKPGRPASVAMLKRAIAVNLPGFPMSNGVILWSVVYPILKILENGAFDEDTVLQEALGAVATEEVDLLTSYSSSLGREEWVRVKCVELEGRRRAFPLPSGASSLWSFSEMDGVSLLPLNSAEVPRGTTLPVWMVRDVPWDRRILFQGSNDPALERITTAVRQYGGDMLLRSVGSMGGLAALARGECHITACHLLHPETGTYNTPFLEEFFGKNPALKRLPLFFRQQGVMVRKGNPKRILSVIDLKRPDVTLVNRQTGAGTRVLLDHLLHEEGIAPQEIRGYENQSVTHFDAANRVSMGFADVALGIKSVADALHLDFIPLCEEPYELVFWNRHEEHPGMKALFRALEDRKWREMVETMGGYRWAE